MKHKPRTIGGLTYHELGVIGHLVKDIKPVHSNWTGHRLYSIIYRNRLTVVIDHNNFDVPIVFDGEAVLKAQADSPGVICVGRNDNAPFVLNDGTIVMQVVGFETD